MRSLASLYGAEALPARAEPLVRKIFSAQKHVLGEEDANTIASMRFLADIYVAEGKVDPAEELLLRVLELVPHKSASAIPVVSARLDELRLERLSELRLEQHDYVHAEETLRHAVVEVDKMNEGRPSLMQLYFRSLLGESLAGQAKYNQAELLLVSAYEGLSEMGLQSTTVLALKSRIEQAGQRIIQLYEDWGKPEKAADWRRKIKSAQAAPPSK